MSCMWGVSSVANCPSAPAPAFIMCERAQTELSFVYWVLRPSWTRIAVLPSLEESCSLITCLRAQCLSSRTVA